jgi:hypothetical protein
MANFTFYNVIPPKVIFVYLFVLAVTQRLVLARKVPHLDPYHKPFVLSVIFQIGISHLCLGQSESLYAC